MKGLHGLTNTMNRSPKDRSP